MAITLDATSGSTVGADTTLTISHTIGAGSNSILLVLATTTLNPNTISGITFNGDALTLVDSQNNSGPNKTAWLYFLLAPDVGTHDIVITTTGSTTITGAGVSFFGVQQETPPIVYKNANTGTSSTNTLTTLVDNSVHLAVWAADANAIDGDTNGTLIAASTGAFYSDPLLVTPAGSHTITVTSSGGSNQFATVGVAIEPVLDSPSLSPSASASPSASLSPSASTSRSASASTSPSASASRSVSASASSSSSRSLSPSASSSRSASSSASRSASRSSSASQSSSASASESRSSSSSVSASASSSLSPSASSSASASASPSLGFTDYTRGDEESLPGNDNDLETVYTAGEVEDVSVRGNDYVSQQGTLIYMLHQFKVFVGAETQCTVEWQGKTTMDPDESPVYLQIFNRNSSQWETLDSESVSDSEIDFELSGLVTALTNYKDSHNIVSCRVYQLAM